MADKMDAHITLTTSDDPPASLTVARSALVAHSKVFADMLSLNLESEAGDKSISLAETEAELKPFLLMVEDKGSELMNTLLELGEGDWETFAKLADKYDSALGRKVVEAKIWEISARQESATLAFTLATLIDDEASICFTAKRAVKIQDLEDSAFHAAREWKQRLAFWRTLHAGKAVSLSQEYLTRVPHGCCNSCTVGMTPSWIRMCGVAFTVYDPRNNTFESKVSEWDDFPARINLGSIASSSMWKC